MRWFTSKFGLALSIIVFSGYILLLPKVTPKFLGYQRTMLYDSFMNDALDNNRIDAVAFWKLREFYSPGYYEFKKEGYASKDEMELFKKFDLATDKAGVFPFLKYESQRIDSFEALVDSPVIPVASENALFASSDCPLKTKTEFICNHNGEIGIYFVKPISEMKKANAFYDYADLNVRKLIEGKYWFVAMIIRLD